MKKVLFVIMVTVFSVGVLHAQQPVVTTDKEAGWHKIGDAKVDFKTDKDKFIPATIMLSVQRFNESTHRPALLHIL